MGWWYQVHDSRSNAKLVWGWPKPADEPRTPGEADDFHHSRINQSGHVQRFVARRERPFWFTTPPSEIAVTVPNSSG